MVPRGGLPVRDRLLELVAVVLAVALVAACDPTQVDSGAPCAEDCPTTQIVAGIDVYGAPCMTVEVCPLCGGSGKVYRK